MWCFLNWLSKEGRPDAAGPSSLLASKLDSFTIEDIALMNGAVKNLKQNARMFLRIQPIEKMKLGVVSDASFANHGSHSQGGHIIIAHEEGLEKENSRVTNVLSWHSGKLQRVVKSTPAAGTQALSRGLGDLLWAMVTLEEFQSNHFEIQKWPERLSATDALALSSDEKTKEVLKSALAVADAKTPFDYLSKEAVGGQGKRTNIEIQIIRDDLKS